MSIEFIIYLSIIAIFVILARHLPTAAKQEKRSEPVVSAVPSVNNDVVELPKVEPSVEQEQKPVILSTESIDSNIVAEPTVVASGDEPQLTDSEAKEKSLDEFFSLNTENDLEDALIQRDSDSGSIPSATAAGDASKGLTPNLSKINSSKGAVASANKDVLLSGLFTSVKGLFAKNAKNVTIKQEKVEQVEQKEVVSSPVSELENLSLEEQNVVKGDRFFEDGDLNRAEDFYLRSVAINPKNPKTYNRLGAIYLRNKNFKEALESFEAARDLDGGKASRHFNVALAAYESKDLVKAKSSIDEALRLDPESPNYRQLKELVG